MTFKIDMPPELRDGFEVHAAALRNGFHTSLYPRQVLIVRDEGGNERSFIHGIPETAQLGPVTYAQDKRMRRALMEAAGLPIPRGGTFSVGRGVAEAKKFAARTGYPVVVKPAIGDNAIEVFADIDTDEQFDQAIERLRVPPSERDSFTRAAYGLTELREPGEEDGRIVVPPGYRFLVEEHVHGDYLRILVIDGAVCSAMITDGSPSIGENFGATEVLHELHPSIAQLAVTAYRAVPGLPLAAVDVVVQDHKAAASSQDLWIVEFSERPGLTVQGLVSPSLTDELADRLLYLAGDTRPRGRGITPIRTKWRAEAIPDVRAAEVTIYEAFRMAGASFEAQEVDQTKGIISGLVTGEPPCIAAISELLLEGRLENIRAMFIQSDIEF